MPVAAHRGCRPKAYQRIAGNPRGERVDHGPDFLRSGVRKRIRCHQLLLVPSLLRPIIRTLSGKTASGLSVYVTSRVVKANRAGSTRAHRIKSAFRNC